MQLSIEPHFFAVRWLTTLFSREFDLHDTFRIWDSLLADPKRFAFSAYLGVAMLWNIEHNLVECDFAQFIKSLQNYSAVNAEEILEKADKIRLSELLRVYEDTHPGYSKRKFRQLSAVGMMCRNVEGRIWSDR